MKKFMILVLLCFPFVIQACASIKSKHQDTVGPSVLDGAWIQVKCTCSGKEIGSSDFQSAYDLFINGNVMFQNVISRWKKTEWDRYCSIHQEARINKLANDSFEITTVSEQTLSPGDTKCNILQHKSSRTWKILSLNKSELKYESTSGCDNGPMICTYKRLDQ